jgi:hypothetical protein
MQPDRLRRSPLTVGLRRRPKPFQSRTGCRRHPVSDAGQEGEHEVELLLNRREISGITESRATWCDGGVSSRLDAAVRPPTAQLSGRSG